MKQNIDLFVILDSMVLLAYMFVWALFFQYSANGEIILNVLLIVWFALLLYFSYNFPKDQFRRIMKKLPGSSFTYIMDREARVEVDNLYLIYRLRPNKAGLRERLKNNFILDISSILPIDRSDDALCSRLKRDLEDALSGTSADGIKFKSYRSKIKLKIELQSRFATVKSVREIQDRLFTVLDKKYDLSGVKNYFRYIDKENGCVVYREFEGDMPSRTVFHDLVDDSFEIDDGNMSDRLADVLAIASPISEEEFNTVMNNAAME